MIWRGGHDKFTDPNYRPDRCRFRAGMAGVTHPCSCADRDAGGGLHRRSVGGMGIDKTLSVITSGFGTTLGSIGLVIGLGVMMGRLLEVSGAAERIAWSFIKWLGKRREEWALAITGYIVSIPIFVDSAFVILYPVAKALAKSGKRSLLTLGVALAGGLVVTHHTVPPTPGPLGVAGIFNVDIGAMLLTGMALAVPCVIGIVFYAQWLDKRYPDFVPRTLNADEVNAALEQYNKEKEQRICRA